MDIEERLKNTLSGRSKEFGEAFRKLFLEIAYAFKIDKCVKFLNKGLSK